jgi:hypothetical protein
MTASTVPPHDPDACGITGMTTPTVPPDTSDACSITGITISIDATDMTGSLDNTGNTDSAGAGNGPTGCGPRWCLRISPSRSMMA